MGKKEKKKVIVSTIRIERTAYSISVKLLILSILWRIRIHRSRSLFSLRFREAPVRQGCPYVQEGVKDVSLRWAARYLLDTRILVSNKVSLGYSGAHPS